MQGISLVPRPRGPGNEASRESSPPQLHGMSRMRVCVQSPAQPYMDNEKNLNPISLFHLLITYSNFLESQKG